MTAHYQQAMSPWPGLQAYARMVTLPGSGVTLHVYDTVDNPSEAVFVLLHGLGDEADTWRYILPTLAQRGRVIAPDLPGFGRSEKPKVAYTVPFFGKVVLELMDRLGVEQAFLLGHSMGALIAHNLALQNPGRVLRLVLLAGGLVARVSRLDPGTLLFMFPGLGEWLYNRLRHDPQAAFRSLAGYYRSLDSLPQEERDFLFLRVNQRVWSNGQRAAFLSALRNLVAWVPRQQKALPGRLAYFSVPALVVWGDADRINPVENGRLLVKMQPLARLVEIPSAGHNLHQEFPQATLNALDAWLASG